MTESKEKVLAINLAGHNTVYAFKNKKKEKPDQPDYTGNGVAVWINDKKDKKEAEASGDSL